MMGLLSIWRVTVYHSGIFQAHAYPRPTQPGHPPWPDRCNDRYLRWFRQQLGTKRRVLRNYRWSCLKQDCAGIMPTGLDSPAQRTNWNALSLVSRTSRSMRNLNLLQYDDSVSSRCTEWLVFNLLSVTVRARSVFFRILNYVASIKS